MLHTMKRAHTYTTHILERKKMKTDNITEHDLITYIFIPSLENMATISIVIELSKQPDIKDALLKHSLEFDKAGGSISWFERNESFKKMEEEIVNKLPLLPLPEQLKANLSNTIRPILCQILEWLRYGPKDVECIGSICWTTRGTIDKVKTLKLLIDNDSGEHISHIFWLSCKYCLEESIPELWRKVPEEEKQKAFYRMHLYKNYSYNFIAYWANNINTLSGLLDSLKEGDHKNIYKINDCVCKNMFQLALKTGNSLEVKYFWDKLTDAEIYTNLEQWIKDAAEKRKAFDDSFEYTNEYTNILFFLLSKINNQEEQRELLQNNIDVILNSFFIDWPWKMCLLPTIYKLWEFIDEKVFLNLLSSTVEASRGEKDTKMLLRCFLYDSPIDFRKRCIQHVLNCSKPTLLCNLLAVGDVETVKVLLNYTNGEEQKRIIFSLIENCNFFDVICKEKFSVFGDMLAEILSESDINRVKERIVFKYGNCLCSDWLCQNDWNVLQNFVNWAFTSEDQIDYFKNEIINKFCISRELLYKGNYELLDKFLDCCFGSEQEISRFKKHFAESELEILNLAVEDWTLFEKFIDWCFDSVQEIDVFRSNGSSQLRDTIYHGIFHNYNFEFVDNLIIWCCGSNEETERYKKEFVLSNDWMSLLKGFVWNSDEVHDSQWSNWELIKKLIKLFSPLSSDVITELKKKIRTGIDFDYFIPDDKNRSFPIKRKHLFRLLDNQDYNISGTGDDTDNDDYSKTSYDYNDIEDYNISGDESSTDESSTDESSTDGDTEIDDDCD